MMKQHDFYVMTCDVNYGNNGLFNPILLAIVIATTVLVVVFLSVIYRNKSTKSNINNTKLATVEEQQHRDAHNQQRHILKQEINNNNVPIVARQQQQVPPMNYIETNNNNNNEGEDETDTTFMTTSSETSSQTTARGGGTKRRFRRIRKRSARVTGWHGAFNRREYRARHHQLLHNDVVAAAHEEEQEAAAAVDAIPSSLLKYSSTPETLVIEEEEENITEPHLFTSDESFKQELQNPRVPTTDEGFPGALTKDEIHTVVQFRNRLLLDSTNTEDKVYKDMVYQYFQQGVEDEPYALCRYLRARDFDINKTYEMMNEHVKVFTEGQQNNFYKDIESVINAPLSILLTQYPFLFSGRSKDGYPLGYFNGNCVTAEGFECITPLDNVPKIQWHILIYKVADAMKKARLANPNTFVRIESFNLVNLKGMSVSQVSYRILEVLKMANEVSETFPETLFGLIVINAPGFFSLTWKVIKQFIDKNVANKIEIYSNEKRGHKRLLELIDEDQLASDYGGTAPSTTEQILRACTTSNSGSSLPPPSSSSSPTSSRRGRRIHRRLSELMSFKKSYQTKFYFDLDNNEMINLTIYTKSTTSVDFSVFKTSNSDSSSNNKVIVDKVTVKGNGTNINIRIASGISGSSSSSSTSSSSNNKSNSKRDYNNNNGRSGNSNRNGSNSVNNNTTTMTKYCIVGLPRSTLSTTEYFLLIGDVYEII